MVCWSDKQILSDINNPDRLKDTQKRLDSRIKLLNNFYIPSMNSQTNNDFENIFLIDRLHKDLDYSQFNFNKKNHKILCLNRLWNPSAGPDKDALDNSIDDFDKNRPPSAEEGSSGIVLSDSLQDYILQTYPDIDLIISTRIDTDDAIQKNFVDNIQNTARQTKKTMFIDYRSVISAQVRNYSPPQIKTFKTFSYGGRDGTMMLSTVCKPEEFDKYHCYVRGHRRIGREFKTRKRIEDIGGLYLQWRGNATKSRLGTHTKLENTEKIKDYFPFLHDYDGKCNVHRFR